MKSLLKNYMEVYSVDESKIPLYIKICDNIFGQENLEYANILLIEPQDIKLLFLWEKYFHKSNFSVINLQFSPEYIEFNGRSNIITAPNINSLNSTRMVYNQEFDYIIDNNPANQIMRYVLYKVSLKIGGHYIFTNAEDINSNKERFLSLSRNVEIHSSNDNHDNCVISIQK